MRRRTLPWAGGCGKPRIVCMKVTSEEIGLRETQVQAGLHGPGGLKAALAQFKG